MRKWTPPGNYTMRESTLGDYVLYSDHVREVGELREALRNALDEWTGDLASLADDKLFGYKEKRILRLRKLLGTSDPTS